ncbi:hypothetical protein N7U66_00535 [Lacinutrix neustonica]|uniref:Uncharacterized protein n=1 Tax=Lacinutrix neustonica TaxID=2980107 RepID=A0A9E8MWF6_9FLAO|nr:hypothetical protein [Lacinutrix neustonica]WAC02296.1 hypothetical protein N7U66_00535 [Lacinutrix neustonica]
MFLDVIQFVGNTTGVIYTDIKQLLLNTTAWDGNNEGIYETYVGDFDIISKQGGYCKVVTATAAIDVTGVTSVSGSAGLNVVDFFGGGNYINGSSPYAGYNFTNDWKVNSPGIAVETDAVAAGNFYYDGPLTTGFTRTISSGAAVEIQGDGTFTTSNLFRFTSAGGGNRLVYDGIEEHSFQINASLSIRVDSAVGNFYAFLIAKNGTVVTESNSIAYIASDVQIQNISINTNLNLISGDYIEVFAERLTGSGNDTLVVFSENLTIK